MNQSELAAITEINPEREALMRFAGLDWRFVRGEGVWLFDEAGKRFLDAYAQYGVLALGHNPPAVTGALKRALEANMAAMVQPYAAVHAEALARELYALAGGHYSRCVFTTSGAEAIEAAIKLARLRTGRATILSAVDSYHGKTLGALSASERLDDSRQAPPSGFARVSYGDAAALADFLDREWASCAAFLVEPIQGEGGVHEPPAGYLERARALCDEHGVLLIADEIQTGLYRAGHALALDAEGVVADIVCVAKALGGGIFPLGACLVTARAWDAGFALAHSSTFANNNLACIAGLAVVEEMRRPQFQANLAATSAQLDEGLAALARRFPASVEAVRGRGLMRGIELRAPVAEAGYFLGYLHQQGLCAYLFASVLARNHGVLVLPVL